MKRLAFCLILCSSILSAAEKIDFNGTLRSGSGSEPKISFQPEYSGYQKRKVLHLKSGQQIIYDLPTAIAAKQCAFRFSFKADSVPPDSLVTLVRFTTSDRLHIVSLGTKRKALIVKVNGDEFKSTGDVIAAGYWLRISVLTNNASETPSLLVNQKEIRLHPVQRPSDSGSATKGNLEITSSGGFNWRIKDLEIGDRLPSEVAETTDDLLLWAAKDLPHFAGKQIVDKTARGGTAWTTDSVLSEEGVRLPAPGKYELAWLIKRVATSPEGDLVSNVYEADHRLASARIKAASLSIDQYDRFVVPFNVKSGVAIRFTLNSFVPIKHSILADSVILRSVNTGWQLHRQIEETHRTMGMVKQDLKAEKGKAIDNENTLTYGPYVCLGQPGKYRATWRLKLSGRIPPKTAVLILNVYAHDGLLTPLRRGNKNYAELPLNSESFPSRDSWETKSMDFQYDGADMMEFRTFTRLFEPGDILLDTVTVERLKDN